MALDLSELRSEQKDYFITDAFDDYEYIKQLEFLLEGIHEILKSPLRVYYANL